MLNIKELNVADLHEKMQKAPLTFRLLDVRSPAEVAQGAIPGAINIPLHLLPARVQELGSETEMVVYCHSGARSAQACMFLHSQGKQNVYNLRGGIVAWLQSGLSLAPAT